MKRLFLALYAATPVIVLACSYYGADPAPPTAMSVDVEIASGGTRYDAGAMAIPATTKQVYVVANVKAPPGDWQLTLAADGALSFADGGTVSTKVVSTADGGPIELQFAATPEPTGTGVIRAALGTDGAEMLTKSFSFVVQPIVASVDVCRVAADGDCVPDIPDASAPAKTQTVVWGELRSLAGFTDGEPVNLVITTDIASERQGVAFRADIGTEGILAIVDADGGTTHALSVDFDGQGQLLVPARIQGSGVGRAFVSIGAGPQASHLVTTASAATAWRRTEYLEHVGLAARNRVTLCSSRSSGVIRVAPSVDGGTISPAEVALSFVPGGSCVAPYPGQADFIWVGNAKSPTWTVTDESSDASTLVQINAVGTDVTDVHAELEYTWLFEPSDAGAPDALAPDGCGMDDGGDAGDCGPPESTVVDAGQPKLLVTGKLFRNALGEVGDKPGTEPLANTSVAVLSAMGLELPDSFTTNAGGEFSFEVTVTAAAHSTSAIFVVDGQRTIVVDKIVP
ncbi:Hypothetical protein A7982_01763 [Minicystis rosea]|nr:Hypothetical protein A7982_01763 [Minicystis rosea]